MDVPVYNKQGKEVAKISIDEASLGGRVKPDLIKQAYVRYHANLRQGSVRTRGRGEVQGSTRKLYRQKGTGRARMGANRTPIRKGGGHAFSKDRIREAFHKDMPIKMRRSANRNALLAKLVDNEVKVLDDLEFKEARTRDFLAILKAVGIDHRALVALPPDNRNARLAARNCEGVTTCPAHELNAFSLLNHRYLVISRADLEAWLTGPSSRTDKSAKPMGGRREARKEAA